MKVSIVLCLLYLIRGNSAMPADELSAYPEERDEYVEEGNADDEDVYAEEGEEGGEEEEDEVEPEPAYPEENEDL